MSKSISFILGMLAVLTFGLLYTQNAAAAGISISPLEYRATLKSGSFEKGHVDIVNPGVTAEDIHLKVQAFRQINDQGGLQFYDDAHTAAGVKLDLTDVELGPGEGARVYFILDASQLPSGDVFAAILASTGSNNPKILSLPSPQVGTLLLLENGTPPPHHAVVKNIQTDWFQTGSSVSARFQVANVDPVGGSAIGFIPKIHVALQPYTSRTVTGPLIFAGRSREVGYQQQGDYFGPVLISASVDGHATSRLIFAVTGFWQWLAPLLLVGIIVVVAVFYIVAKRRKAKRSGQTDARSVE